MEIGIHVLFSDFRRSAPPILFQVQLIFEVVNVIRHFFLSSISAIFRHLSREMHAHITEYLLAVRHTNAM